MNLLENLNSIKNQSPLIHNITNFVTMDFIANSLLAIGGLPVMSHAEEELEEMISYAKALVINIGTLDDRWMDRMLKAAIIAKNKNIPVVLDPVGAGATKLRTNFALELLKTNAISVVRGNASEIMSLVNFEIKSKGVESTHASDSAVSSAMELAKKYKNIFIISGQVDYITDGEEVLSVNHGDAMMAKVTGMGCVATAVVGAFVAVNNNFKESATHAMMAMGLAGEKAKVNASGPASFKVNFIDQFYNLEKNV